MCKDVGWVLHATITHVNHNFRSPAITYFISPGILRWHYNYFQDVRVLAVFGRRPWNPLQVGQVVEWICQENLRITTKSLSKNLFGKLNNSIKLLFFIPQRIKVFNIEYLDEGIFDTCKWMETPEADSPRKQRVGLAERRMCWSVWFPAVSLASYDVFVYITRCTLHPSAPCPRSQHPWAASAVSLALWYLCSAMGSLIRNQREGEKEVCIPIPWVPFLCGHFKLTGPLLEGHSCYQGGPLHVTLFFWALVYSLHWSVKDPTLTCPKVLHCVLEFLYILPVFFK